MIVLSLVVLAVAGVLLVVGILQGDSGTVTLAASIGTTVLAAVLLYFGVRPRGAVPGDADTTDRPERSPALASVPAAAGSAAPPAKTAAGKTSAGTAAGAAKVPAGAATATTATTAGTAISTSAPGTTSAAGTSAAGTTGTAGGAGGHRAPDDAPAGGRTSDGSTSDGSTSAGRSPDGRSPDGRASDGRRGGAAVDEAATAASDDDPPDEPAIERASLGDLARIAARDDEVVVVDGRPRYHLVTCAHLTDRESEGLPVSEAAELGFTPCARCAPVASLIAG
jgi:hypothetical protein